MWRWAVGVFLGLLFIGVVAWNAGRQSVEVPEVRQPTEADRIISFCSQAVNKASPLCRVDPEAPEDVRGAVREIVERQSPQIIERRETIREDKDDDEAAPPEIEVNVPPPSAAPQQPSPTPTRTQRPLLPEVEVPELPELGLPLLP